MKRLGIWMLVAAAALAAAACGGRETEPASSRADSAPPPSSAPAESADSSAVSEPSSAPESPSSTPDATSAPSAASVPSPSSAASSKPASSKISSAAPSRAPSSAAPSSAAPSDNRLKPGETFTDMDIEFRLISYAKTGNEAKLRVSVKNPSATDHPVHLNQRYHLTDAEGERIAAVRIENEAGEDLRTRIIAPGETLDAVVTFTLPADFRPVTFSYTYDIMGFRAAKYKVG